LFGSLAGSYSTALADDDNRLHTQIVLPQTHLKELYDIVFDNHGLEIEQMVPSHSLFGNLQ